MYATRIGRPVATRDGANVIKARPLNKRTAAVFMKALSVPPDNWSSGSRRINEAELVFSPSARREYEYTAYRTSANDSDPIVTASLEGLEEHGAVLGVAMATYDGETPADNPIAVLNQGSVTVLNQASSLIRQGDRVVVDWNHSTTSIDSGTRTIPSLRPARVLATSKKVDRRNNILSGAQTTTWTFDMNGALVETANFSFDNFPLPELQNEGTHAQHIKRLVYESWYNIVTHADQRSTSFSLQLLEDMHSFMTKIHLHIQRDATQADGRVTFSQVFPVFILFLTRQLTNMTQAALDAQRLQFATALRDAQAKLTTILTLEKMEDHQDTETNEIIGIAKQTAGVNDRVTLYINVNGAHGLT